MPANMDEANQASAAGPGYETRDANTSAVLGFMAVLFVVLVLILFGVWRLFRYYSLAERQPDAASSFSAVRQIAPSPELAVNGREELLKMYAKQQQELEAYSWEDRKAGTVRIPIERAMDLLLQKGLPVLPSGAGNGAGSGVSKATRSDGAAGAEGGIK